MNLKNLFLLTFFITIKQITGEFECENPILTEFKGKFPNRGEGDCENDSIYTKPPIFSIWTDNDGDGVCT